MTDNLPMSAYSAIQASPDAAQPDPAVGQPVTIQPFQNSTANSPSAQAYNAAPGLQTYRGYLDSLNQPNQAGQGAQSALNSMIGNQVIQPVLPATSAGSNINGMLGLLTAAAPFLGSAAGGIIDSISSIANSNGGNSNSFSSGGAGGNSTSNLNASGNGPELGAFNIGGSRGWVPLSGGYTSPGYAPVSGGTTFYGGSNYYPRGGATGSGGDLYGPTLQNPFIPGLDPNQQNSQTYGNALGGTIGTMGMGPQTQAPYEGLSGFGPGMDGIAGQYQAIDNGLYGGIPPGGGAGPGVYSQLAYTPQLLNTYGPSPPPSVGYTSANINPYQGNVNSIYAPGGPADSVINAPLPHTTNPAVFGDSTNYGPNFPGNSTYQPVQQESSNYYYPPMSYNGSLGSGGPLTPVTIPEPFGIVPGAGTPSPYNYTPITPQQTITDQANMLNYWSSPLTQFSTGQSNQMTDAQLNSNTTAG